MIEIHDALSLVLDRVASTGDETVSLDNSLGRILSEVVVADLDSPPHDKALMDGYAVRSRDLTTTDGLLEVIEEVMAGQTPCRELAAGQATRIMTGAPIPKGADCVIMVERTEVTISGQTEHVTVHGDANAGENILERGIVMKAGDRILQPGRRIRGTDVGLLAEVGRSQLNVARQPTVAVLSTGDELVTVTDKPAAGQIRNSNGPMLCALAKENGGVPKSLGIGKDELRDLDTKIRSGIDCDILLLSGGVSMGQRDLVPQVLGNIGVETVFHRVNLRPGKPLWFGLIRQESRRTCVFGLPGNPVSSLVCFVLFVVPAMRKMVGLPPELRRARSVLAEPQSIKGNRPTYFPAKHTSQDGKIVPLAWKGSADLRTIVEADCLAYLPGPREFAAGDTVETISIS